MRKDRLVTVGIIVLILAIAGVIIYSKTIGFGTVGGIIKDTPSEAFSKYLGKNAVLYVQTGCVHCEEQEDLFGTNIKYLTTIDCLTDSQACIVAGIEATPTWIIDGQKYVGVQSIEKLKEITGYQD
jgi:hypothetical protein